MVNIVDKIFGQFRTQLRSNLFVRKPMFLYRVARHYIENITSPTKSRLRTMTIMINSECNARCEHCFAESFNEKLLYPNKLTLDEMKSAIKEMIENGVYHFCLQGGETFLHPQLDELILACEPKKSFVTLVTNRTVANKKRLREVYELGVDKIAVSIDSYFPEEHDKFRGKKGCHAKALETVKNSLEMGLEVGIAITVTNETLHTDSVQKLLAYAISNKINVDINIPQPVGNWDGRLDIILTDENFAYINELHRKNTRIRRDLYPHIGRAGCPAVKESMHIDLFGNIYPCVYIHLAIGNIKHNYLKDIRANAMRIREFLNYEPKCIAGEDRLFIEKYISKGFGVKKPADGFKIFNLPQIPVRTTPLTNEIKQEEYAVATKSK